MLHTSKPMHALMEGVFQESQGLGFKAGDSNIRPKCLLGS
jgi:hypothetical protein